ARALIELVATAARRGPDAEGALARARAALERTGGAPDLAVALDAAAAKLAIAEGRPEAAIAPLQRARRVLEARYGADGLRAVALLRLEGAVEILGGRTDAARARLERMAAIERRVLGADHPDVAAAESALAGSAEELREFLLADHE